MSCEFPNCKSNADKGSKYCIGHKKMMGESKVKADKNTIAKTSDKENSRQNKYKKIRKQFLVDHPKCEVEGCRKVAVEVHHKAGRVGENLFNDLLAVCSGHHRMIETQPQWAKDNGYSISRLNKHNVNANF